MQTNVHFWSYLAQFFIEWEMFQTKDVEKIKTQFFLHSYRAASWYWRSFIYSPIDAPVSCLKNNIKIILILTKLYLSTIWCTSELS